MTESLLERTRRLLQASKERRPEIARAAGVTYEWLKKFESQSTPNPGVNYVQQLHDYLVGQLTVETSQCRNVG
jgi:transcriptional regulator with XRE-family HTH domain